MNKEKVVYKVSIVSIIVNVILTIVKFLAGIFSHSQAMISDSVHSLSDILSTVVVIVGVKISSKKADETHPYGHDRFECVATIILAIMLLWTGLGIGLFGFKSIINGSYSKPGMFSLYSAILSIITKEAMYWYTYIVAKKIKSDALVADAWHHRSDALSSIGSMIGIIGARMGYLYLDSVASIVISIFIMKVAIDIFKNSIDKMVDKSCDNETINRINELISSNKNIIQVDELRTRQFGSTAYVDIDVSVDGNLSFETAHNIAEDLHHSVEENIPIVKHCMVHVSPWNEKTLSNK